MRYKKYLMLVFALCGTTIVGSAQEKKAYIVSNAHFDSQWNWDVQTSIREYIPKTLERNLLLLKKYPHYVFNFEGGIKYHWMKEYYPDLFEQMKSFVKLGRWHVTGSTWDATDANIPSPESLTRNILYGQHFYRNELGVEGTDIFLPDCFGFGWTLPTVAAHCGLIGFSTQKLKWREKPFYGESKIPFEIGLWKGVDGSAIMLVADARNYTTKWADSDLSHSEELRKLTEDSPLGLTYHYYGTGDTGGSPTLESVKAVEKGVQGDGPVKIISATSDQLYKDFLPFASHPELPQFDGELLMDVHGTGCYTSQAAMKLYNRRNELLADAAERAAVLADWTGAQPYPHATLSEAWKRVIWHQFHDDLTGTSIPRAYEFSWNDELISLKQFAGVLQSSVERLSQGLDTRVKGVPLVLFNSSAFAYNDLLELTVRLPKATREVALYDATGQPVPCQVLQAEGESVTLLAKVSLPSLSLQVYDLRMQKPRRRESGIRVTKEELENSVYRVSLDQNGDIASVVDKRNGKELVAPGQSIRLALLTDNKSYRWPAWEIMKSTLDQTPRAISDNVSISIAEQGSLRGSLRVERTYGESRFVQYIRLNEGAEADRLEIVNEVDWHASGCLLKAEFPLTATHPMATYDLGIGTIQRGNNTPTAYEVYAQRWADLTHQDQTYGVSVMSDSKYGWDKPTDHTLRLTLLHTPQTRNSYTYQNQQDLGHHRFAYALVAHEGALQPSVVQQKAEQFNQTPVAFVASRHKGSWGRQFSLAETGSRQVILKTLKKAEDEDGYILRFYETAGQEGQGVEFSFACPILEAQEVNGVEDSKEKASFEGGTLRFDIPANGIKSFKVKLAAATQPLTSPATVPLTLPFDTKATSYNAFRSEVNLDGQGYSMAAELWPEEMVHRGIPFNLGEADGRNTLKCRGQEIALPAGSYNRIYLLATSLMADQKVTFQVGRSSQEVVVPSYTGYIGQWGHSGHTEAYLKQADIAYVGTHRHSSLKKEDCPYEYTYLYRIALEVPQGATSLRLPHAPKLALFAATAATDQPYLLQPATDLLKVSLPLLDDAPRTDPSRNLLFQCPAMEKSGEVNQRERAELATDEESDTKWCDAGDAAEKFIAFDLGATRQIRSWKVLHATMEAPSFTTRDFQLQVKKQKQDAWQTVDGVTDNQAIETQRTLAQPVQARYVRLLITRGEQLGHVARIYEFGIYE